MTSVVNINKTRRGRGASIRIKSPKVIVRRRSESSQTRTRKQENMVTKLMQLEVKINDISKEQSSLMEGQRQVKQKFEAIESECENLRQETVVIMQQSACTRLRLAFMFEILKARESNDLARAAELTHALRKVITHQTRMMKVWNQETMEQVGNK